MTETNGSPSPASSTPPASFSQKRENDEAVSAVPVKSGSIATATASSSGNDPLLVAHFTAAANRHRFQQQQSQHLLEYPASAEWDLMRILSALQQQQQQNDALQKNVPSGSLHDMLNFRDAFTAASGSNPFLNRIFNHFFRF